MFTISVNQNKHDSEVVDIIYNIYYGKIRCQPYCSHYLQDALLERIASSKLDVHRPKNQSNLCVVSKRKMFMGVARNEDIGAELETNVQDATTALFSEFEEHRHYSRSNGRLTNDLFAYNWALNSHVMVTERSVVRCRWEPR